MKILQLLLQYQMYKCAAFTFFAQLILNIYQYVNVSIGECICGAFLKETYLLRSACDMVLETVQMKHLIVVIMQSHIPVSSHNYHEYVGDPPTTISTPTQPSADASPPDNLLFSNSFHIVPLLHVSLIVLMIIDLNSNWWLNIDETLFTLKELKLHASRLGKWSLLSGPCLTPLMCVWDILSSVCEVSVINSGFTKTWD